MSFEHPAFHQPQTPSKDASKSEQVDDVASPTAHSPLTSEQGYQDIPVAPVYVPHIPYNPRGFLDIYEEAKHLRRHSGKAAVAFIMIFLVLYGAGSYAELVESQRMDPMGWEALSDTTQFGSNMLVFDRAPSEAPTFLERFGLKVLAALGSIGFFVFAAAAVAEISFRTYEGRNIEGYEVLDTLSKSHGTKLLRLGVFFMLLLLLVGVVNIGLTIDPGEFRFPFFVIVMLFAQYYILLRTIFAVHSMIGEDLSPIEALHRSWDITDGNVLRLIWWGIIFWFLFMIVTSFLYILPMIIVSGIIVSIFFSGLPSAIPEVVGVLTLFILPFLSRQISLVFFFQMALYRELRLRYDGIDPQDLSSQHVPMTP